ncbi:MAG: pantetheine-phosphate adenylyltransferase [Acutalibacteraceae bacterium]|nr:pantetheine-phosphate adenylyltransferase [Clostridia bacterium]MEE0981869.1 pantetheine-phosphate adenylyltransferase [Acutalibacteraceae bacterium]
MKIAIYPGSFDPITNGHLSVIRRAAKLFDEVLVVVMINHKKPVGCFSYEERMELIKRCTKDIPNVKVDYYAGLLADYAREKDATAIVKGLRAVSDFEHEFQQALTNKELNPDVETVFVTAGADYMYLSSSIVKQVCQFGGDVSKFVPPEVYEDIVKGIKKKG